MPRLLVLALTLGAVVAGGPARAAPDPVETAALAQAANRHAQAAAALRARTWNADTVRHLARWAGGDPQGATSYEISLLKDEVGRPVSLSVSGAVSMGSYQGGFLYYLVDALQAARKLGERSGAAVHETWVPPAQGSPLSVVTGASSGSINAFIAAVASCKQPEPNPRESLFWRVWFPVGGEALLSPERVFPDGLLSIEPIDGAVARLEDAWNAPTWDATESCAVVVGLSATRMRARLVAPLEDLSLPLPLQTEKLMFSMHGQNGAAPTLAPFVPPVNKARDRLFRQLFRQLGRPDQPLVLRDVTDVLRASSAFSLAFPPAWLKLTSREDQSKDQPDNQWFTDGGVFDDRPVGLAVEIQRWRLTRDNAGKADKDKKDEADLHVRYIVQDPDVVLIPGPAGATPPPADQAAHRPLVDTWLPFVGDFINTAFEIELLDALEREPTLLPGLEVPPRRVPVAGAYLMEFLAFAERDFRTFDFFTGMVDAWQHLAESSLAFQVLLAMGAGPTFVGAPEFDCLRAWRAHQLMNAGPPTSPACAAMGARTGVGDEPLGSNLQALVHASAVTDVWRRDHPDHADPPGAQEQRVFLDALGTAPLPYHYRDLTYRGSPATARTVELAIRDRLQTIVERTTFNQDDGVGRFVVGGVGKALLNYYEYRPPSVYADLALVTSWGLQLGGGARLPWNRWRPPFVDLGVDGAVRVVDIHRAPDGTYGADAHPMEFTYMLAAHLTNELQLQDAGAGWQSAVQVHFGFGWAVESLQTWNGPLLWRHGPEALAGLSLFQRLTLDVLVNRFLDDCAGNNGCSHVEPGIGDQLSPLVTSDWAVRLAIGFRFFMD